MKNPSMITWVGWIGATIVAACIFCAFAFTNFETKDEAKDKKADIVKSLDEIKTEIHEIHKELRDE